jgi:hypothetical protein
MSTPSQIEELVESLARKLAYFYAKGWKDRASEQSILSAGEWSEVNFGAFVDPATDFVFGQIAAAHASQTSEHEKQFAELTAKLSRIEATSKADAEDLKKMRDGTKLTREGLVQVIAYLQEDVAELTRKLEEANRDLNTNIGLRAKLSESQAARLAAEEKVKEAEQLALHHELQAKELEGELQLASAEIAEALKAKAEIFEDAKAAAVQLMGLRSNLKRWKDALLLNDGDAGLLTEISAAFESIK